MKVKIQKSLRHISGICEIDQFIESHAIDTMYLTHILKTKTPHINSLIHSFIKLQTAKRLIENEYEIA